ncbi:MAG: hypothetical protein EAZ91_11930 [Cytophagales bacterium]|nr:MAG: hypothetical protein EAZ91_11930 [Cytophagales bacterium]
MKSKLLLKRLSSTPYALLLGILTVILFVAVVVLLFIPYSLFRLLARYTPVGRIPVPVSMS